MTKQFAKYITALIIALGITSFTGGSFVVFAQANSSYTIQLKVADPVILSGIPGITNIQPMFENAADSKLARTYQFESSSSLSVLQQIYRGYYDYLETDEQFSNSATKPIIVSPNDPGFTTNPANIDICRAPATVSILILKNGGKT